EVYPFIAALLTQGLVFQAFHQHFIMLTPPVWFVHFRGVGEPLDLARQIRAALDVTHIPLPQSAPPPPPTTPLDPEQLARLLHGEAEVGEQGVVTVTVHRTTGVRIEGVPVQPETGISTSIEFQPLGGTTAAVVPDFAMT